MDKIFKFTGKIVWVIILIFFFSLLYYNFFEISNIVLNLLGGLVIIYLLIRFYLGKEWMSKLFKEMIVGQNLIDAVNRFLNELPKPNKAVTSNLIGHLVYRFTRIGIIGLLIALIPILLLYNQNQLISQQNELIKLQTHRLDQQTNLQEAERRSSLVFLFSNIMDAIDRELSNDYGNNNIRDLSPQLIGRISALSLRLLPYRYLENDSLIEKPYSPERGQLLVSLVNADLDKETYNKIYKQSSFEYSVLEGISLEYKYLKYINLSNSSLKKSNFKYCNLSFSNLTGSDLENAYFYGGDLSYSKIGFINYRETEFTLIEFNGVRTEKNNLIEKISYNKNSTGFLKENYKTQRLIAASDTMAYVFIKTNTVDFLKYCNCRLMVEKIALSNPKIKNYFEDASRNNNDIYFSHSLSPFGSIDNFDEKADVWAFSIKITNDDSPIIHTIDWINFNPKNKKLYLSSDKSDTIEYDTLLIKNFLDNDCFTQREGF